MSRSAYDKGERMMNGKIHLWANCQQKTVKGVRKSSLQIRKLINYENTLENEERKTCNEFRRFK